jgi:Flp pilus assembly protein TadD
LARTRRSGSSPAPAAYEEAVRLSPGEPLAVAFLAHALALADRADDARRRLAELIEVRARRYVSAYDLAVVHAGLGEVDAAVDRLERGHQERTHWMALLGVDPRLDPLRSNPRFARLLEAMQLG